MLQVQVQNTLSMPCFQQDIQSICNSINFGIVAYFGALVLALYSKPYFNPKSSSSIFQ
jgi:hypothetical protein